MPCRMKQEQNLSNNEYKEKSMKQTLFNRRFVFVLASLLALGALEGFSVQASPAILYVAPGANCGGASPCYGDIQAAVNAASTDDEIRIAQGIYSQIGTSSGITAVVRVVDKKLTLRGGYSISDWNTSDPEANPTVIDADDNGIGMYINYQADIGIGTITVEGLSITGGNATEAGAGTDSGGGIFVDHTTHVKVTVQNCKIYENTAEDTSGGGIWTTRSDNLQIVGNEVYDNQGSGIVVTYGDNTVIVDNMVENNVGGGIAVISDLGGGTDIRSNQVTDNQGTGITLNTATGGSLAENLVTGNHTTGGGGGLDISGAVNDFVISDNTVCGNSALQGGGIDISGSVAVVRDNLVESNFTTASSNGGGGLYVDSGASGAYVLVSGNQVLSNTTTNQGGGLLVLGYVDVMGNTIADNSATSGGGLIATATGKIGHNLVRGNWASTGGGIRIVNSTGLSLERNRIIDNRATGGEGGGLNVWGGFFMDVNLDGNQVISNTATTKGGGVYLECPDGSDPIDMSNTVLAGNLAATGSGLYSTVCETNMAYSTVASNRGPWGDGVGFYLRDPIDGSAAYSIENTIVVSQAVGIYVESGNASMEATFWGSGDWANDVPTAGPGGIYTGTQNYEGAPAFVNPDLDDYHIMATFPAIDKGVDTWTTVDLDGQSRPSGETDIGADEYWLTLKVFLPLIQK
jgi:parallel beta-helix repeat protein